MPIGVNHGRKAARWWISWTSFKLGFFAGAIAGMLVMAIVMAGMTRAPEAQRLLHALASQALDQ